MKLTLKLLFATIFVVMVWVNLKAALAMNILASFPLFGANPWEVATLYDAYCGFLTFYVWVAYKERALWAKGPWFLLVMGLGNVAMSAYVLKELFKLKPEEPVWKLLQNRPRLKRLRDNKLTRHIVGLLKQGITPQKISLAVVLGVVLGIAPVLGTTIVSCTVTALALRLNLALIQIVNNLVYPLQLLLLIPFVQAGQWLFREAPMPLSASQIVAMVKHDFWGSIVALAGYTFHGAVAWLLLSLVFGTLGYFLLLFPLKRAMQKHA